MSNQEPLILTHCGQLGDFIYSWPVAAWLHRTSGRRIHWVLPRVFGPFNYINRLAMMQSFTHSVTLVDHPLKSFAHGGQPYRFDPAAFGITGEYLNLGFRGYPDKYIPAYIAEEHARHVSSSHHGLYYDEEWTLQLGIQNPESRIQNGLQEQFVSFLANAPEQLVSGYLGEKPNIERFLELLKTLPPGDSFFAYVPPLETPEADLYTEHANFPAGRRINLMHDVLFNARWMRASVNRHCFYSSMAVILYFARVPFKLYRQPGHPGEEHYFPDRSRYELHNLPA